MAKTTATNTSDIGVELSQALAELVNAQTRHSLEILAALATTIDWDRAFWLQGELLRASMDRAAQLTQCYLDLTQAVLDAAADAAKDRAGKAA